jgi:hypothetical protein
MAKNLLTSFAFLISAFAFSQVNVRDSLVNGWLITVQAGAHMPGGDIASRFNNNMMIGAGLHYKLRSNWIIGADGFYRYGNSVNNRDQVFRDIQTRRGEILSVSGDVAIVNLFQSGWNAQVNAAKIFSEWGHNANSGFTVMVGAGYGQNWIRIDNPGNDAPNITGEYRKGYDQLHAGIHMHQIIGYTYLSSYQSVNFFIGFEFMQGYTENMRGFNFTSRMQDSGIKRDFYYGVRLMWFITIYDKNAQTFYYY